MSEVAQPAIQGVYENIIGSSNREASLRYWAQLGYGPVAEGQLERQAAFALYGVDSALQSVRLRNGNTATHGHVRLMCWQEPPAPGLEQVRPLTVGSRWFASRTADIVAVRDAYMDAIQAGERWTVSDLIRNIIVVGHEAEGFYDRFQGVREMMVLGQEVRQVYFQRYGYHVPGYGTIEPDAPLPVSEATHSSIVIANLSQVSFYVDVLGLKQEQVVDAPPAAPDPRPDVTIRGNSEGLSVLMRRAGEVYHFSTLVASSDTAGVGRIYVFQPQDTAPNLQSCARPGVTGLCLLTYRVRDLATYHQRLSQSAASNLTPILPNEFGEPTLCFDAPDGTAWSLIEFGSR